MKQTEKLSIYIAEKYQDENLPERIAAIAKREDRSVNYIVTQALVEYVEKHEVKK
jgi:predicted transcriptional regulator